MALNMTQSIGNRIMQQGMIILVFCSCDKTQGPRKLIEELSSWFQRVRVRDHHGKEHHSRQVATALKQLLRAPT